MKVSYDTKKNWENESGKDNGQIFQENFFQ